MANKKDGRLVALANENRVLRSLHRFGWLRTRDLAVLCWTRWASRAGDELVLTPAAATSSSLRMAQRTLKRMLKKRYVMSAQAPDQSIVYTLAAAGVRKLQQTGVNAQSGKDTTRFSAAFFRHRCISNEIAIAAICQGYRASSDREISQGLSICGVGGFHGKRPDVVIREGHDVTFIEVEKSRKKVTEYKLFLTWLVTMLQLQKVSSGRIEINPEAVLKRVIFICTKVFQSKLEKDLLAVGWSLESQSALIGYSSDIYVFKDILFP